VLLWGRQGVGKQVWVNSSQKLSFFRAKCEYSMLFLWVVIKSWICIELWSFVEKNHQ
jgi:hypothetical protein